MPVCLEPRVVSICQPNILPEKRNKHHDNIQLIDDPKPLMFHDTFEFQSTAGFIMLSLSQSVVLMYRKVIRFHVKNCTIHLSNKYRI